MKQLNVTESEYSDSESDLHVIDPVLLQQKTQSRVHLVAKELIQAVDDDSDTSGSDMENMDFYPKGQHFRLSRLSRETYLLLRFDFSSVEGP